MQEISHTSTIWRKLKPLLHRFKQTIRALIGGEPLIIPETDLEDLWTWVSIGYKGKGEIVFDRRSPWLAFPYRMAQKRFLTESRRFKSAIGIVKGKHNVKARNLKLVRMLRESKGFPSEE